MVNIHRQGGAVTGKVHALLGHGVPIGSLGLQFHQHLPVVIKGDNDGSSFILDLAVLSIGRAAQFIRIFPLSSAHCTDCVLRIFASSMDASASRGKARFLVCPCA